MKLPHLDNVRVDREKIVDYLLNPEHSEGGHKAVFFASFRFRLADWQVLASALLRHAADNHVVREVPTAYGTMYVVEGPLYCPDRRRPVVRTVWIVNKGSTAPRLVTAYPLKLEQK
ncbi:MAG: DUF6883 domain-containing protein [Longimicrobiales bacterium]